MSKKSWITFLWLILGIATSSISFAAPQDAEQYTHIAGSNLADLYSFDDLANKFGKSKVVNSGDAADADSRTCYKTSDGKTAVIFFHGEVNWGFTVRYPQKMDARCPRSHALTPDLTNIAHIELGMGKAAYKKIVGKPSKENSNRVIHKFQYVHKLTDEELNAMIERGRQNGYPEENPEDLRSWWVIISLAAVFNKGRLTSFTVDRVETN